MTDGEHRGAEDPWRPPDVSPATPEPSEEPPPPPPPAAARQSGAPPHPPGSPGGGGDRRSGRAKLLLAILAAALAVVVLVGLAVAAVTLATDGDEPTTGSANEPSEPGDDPSDGEDDPVADLDLDALSGRDEAFGQLLLQVDASEQVMIAFQSAVEETLSDPSAEDPEQLVEQLRAAAEAGQQELAEVRTELARETGDPSADEVRSVYLEHHDVWADYLAVIVENPAVLAGDDSGRWSVAINASAEAFERTLRENLDGLDEDVRDLAEHILGRGFDRGEIRPDA